MAMLEPNGPLHSCADLLTFGCRTSSRMSRKGSWERSVRSHPYVPPLPIESKIGHRTFRIRTARPNGLCRSCAGDRHASC